MNDLVSAGPLDAARLCSMLDALAQADPDLRAAIARVGYPAPRQRDPGFGTLLRIILAQQVSTASAAALWRKLEAALGGDVTPASFLTLDDRALRACGFSARKVEYARGMCAAILGQSLDLAALALLEEEAAISALVALRGFGRWSAEIYLLFALGRADVFPADDLAVQIAYQRLKRLDARPSAKALRALTEPWRPYRGAAAVFLWHYYGAATLDDWLAVLAAVPAHGRIGEMRTSRRTPLGGDPRIAIDPVEVGRIVEDVFPEALGVWIYGSFAQGRARRDSDLDIAILPDRPIDAWERLERAQDVAERVHREVDLVDLRTVSPVLRFEVVTRGRRVAARDPDAATSWTTSAIKMFQRLNEGQREHLAAVKARGSRRDDRSRPVRASRARSRAASNGCGRSMSGTRPSSRRTGRARTPPCST